MTCKDLSVRFILMLRKKKKKNLLNKVNILFFLLTLLLLVVSAIYIKKFYLDRQDLDLFPVSTDDNTPVHLRKFSDLVAANKFEEWQNWYPVDFNQPENYRVVNWWSSDNKKNNWFNGHSSLNVVNTLPTLPTTYKGLSVDYFFLWQCRYPFGNLDKKCYDSSLYREIISQSGQDLYHWSRGSSKGYEVYYNSTLIGLDNCSSSNIKNYPGNLEDSNNKQPWALRLPVQKGSYFVSDVFCSLVFKGYSQTKDSSQIIDSRSLGGKSNYTFETGNWLSITLTHDNYNEDDGNKVIYAENIYLTDNQKSSQHFTDEYCKKINKSDTLRCVGSGEGRSGLTITKDGRTYQAFGFEEYWMRKTEKSSTSNVIGKYGFGAFRWWQTYPKVEWDKVSNNGLENSGSGSNNQVYSIEKCNLDKWFNVINCAPESKNSSKLRIKK